MSCCLTPLIFLLFSNFIYLGEFQIFPDEHPYLSVAELYYSVQIGALGGEGTRFENKKSIYLEDKTVIDKGEILELVGLEEKDSTFLKFSLLKEDTSPFVLLPLTCNVELQECHDDQFYTLDMILQWKMLFGRKRFVKITKGHSLPCLQHFRGVAHLSPTYSFKVVCSGGTETIVASDLDIEVIEVSGKDWILNFTMTLNMIYRIPVNEFPIEVTVSKVSSEINTTSGFRNLEVGQCLTILKKKEIKKCIVTESAKQHFLVPSTYQGTIVKTPRSFPFAFDLFCSRTKEQGIRVLVRKAYKAEVPLLSSLEVGDELQVLTSRTVVLEQNARPQELEVVECVNVNTNQTINIPMYAEGQFLEILGESQVCTLAELLSQPHSVPCNVMVVKADPSVESDPLPGLKELRLEMEISDPCLIALRRDPSPVILALPIDRVKVSIEVTVHWYNKKESVQTYVFCHSNNVETLHGDQYAALQEKYFFSKPAPLPRCIQVKKQDSKPLPSILGLAWSRAGLRSPRATAELDSHC
ncbi:THMS3 protein, partial [Amia calva]|nr:THMS3 protein [Amia calva]